jgi:hypothetical protein
VLGVVLYTDVFSIVITVENVGDVPIQNVRIEMWGKVYDLGDIEPGASETEFTFPTGDSGVKLLWMSSGVDHEDWIAGYVSLGYNGKIDVEVEEGEVVGLAGDRAIVQK